MTNPATAMSICEICKQDDHAAEHCEDATGGAPHIIHRAMERRRVLGCMQHLLVPDSEVVRCLAEDIKIAAPHIDDVRNRRALLSHEDRGTFLRYLRTAELPTAAP
jgi:hypothetical protein